MENEESEVTRSETVSKCYENKAQKMYSLIPDLLTGWKPKNIKIPSPILIKYKSPLVAQLLDYYEDNQKRIVYIGNFIFTKVHDIRIL